MGLIYYIISGFGGIGKSEIKLMSSILVLILSSFSLNETSRARGRSFFLLKFSTYPVLYYSKALEAHAIHGPKAVVLV